MCRCSTCYFRSLQALRKVSLSPIIQMIKLKHSVTCLRLQSWKGAELACQLYSNTQAKAFSSTHLPCPVIKELLGDLEDLFFKTEFLRNVDRGLRTLGFNVNIDTIV